MLFLHRRCANRVRQSSNQGCVHTLSTVTHGQANHREQSDQTQGCDASCAPFNASSAPTNTSCTPISTSCAPINTSCAPIHLLLWWPLLSSQTFGVAARSCVTVAAASGAAATSYYATRIKCCTWSTHQRLKATASSQLNAACWCQFYSLIVGVETV